MSLYTYRARLTEHPTKHPIHDADSARISVDAGFGITKKLGMCRLYGINAPEVYGAQRPKGIAARDFLRDLVQPGQWFTVKTIKNLSDDHDKKGKWGRYLVTIILDDGTNINELLVETGHAVAREY